MAPGRKHFVNFEGSLTHPRTHENKLTRNLKSLYQTDQSNRLHSSILFSHINTSFDFRHALCQKKIHQIRQRKALRRIKHIQTVFMGHLIRKYVRNQLF